MTFSHCFRYSKAATASCLPSLSLPNIPLPSPWQSSLWPYSSPQPSATAFLAIPPTLSQIRPSHATQSAVSSHSSTPLFPCFTPDSSAAHPCIHPSWALTPRQGSFDLSNHSQPIVTRSHHLLSPSTSAILRAHRFPWFLLLTKTQMILLVNLTPPVTSSNFLECLLDHFLRRELT